MPTLGDSDDEPSALEDFSTIFDQMAAEYPGVIPAPDPVPSAPAVAADPADQTPPQVDDSTAYGVWLGPDERHQLLQQVLHDPEPAAGAHRGSPDSWDPETSEPPVDDTLWLPAVPDAGIPSMRQRRRSAL